MQSWIRFLFIIPIVPPPPPPPSVTLLYSTEPLLLIHWYPPVPGFSLKISGLYLFSQKNRDLKKFEGPHLSMARIGGVLIFYTYPQEGLGGRWLFPSGKCL
jgi:hypothetical protein